MIIRRDLSKMTVPQRHDRRRARVMGITLRRLRRVEYPHPRRQRRGNIDHVLTRRDQLLREEIPETGCGLDRPPPQLEPRRPIQQHVTVFLRRPHLQLGQRALVLVDRDRSVRPLVRVDTDQHQRHDECLSVEVVHDGHS